MTEKAVIQFTNILVYPRIQWAILIGQGSEQFPRWVKHFGIEGLDEDDKKAIKEALDNHRLAKDVAGVLAEYNKKHYR